MIAASLAVFVAILRLVLGGKVFRDRFLSVIIVSVVVNVGGMLFGKYGATGGLPWWIYYPIPALLTLLLVPIVFRLRPGRAVLYVILAFASAPIIHVAFSALLGWNEYLPFLPVPHLFAE